MNLEFGKKYELHNFKRITRICPPPMLRGFGVEFENKKNKIIKKL